MQYVQVCEYFSFIFCVFGLRLVSIASEWVDWMNEGGAVCINMGIRLGDYLCFWVAFGEHCEWMNRMNEWRRCNMCIYEDICRLFFVFLDCIWWALWVNGSNEWMKAVQSNMKICVTLFLCVWVAFGEPCEWMDQMNEWRRCNLCKYEDMCYSFFVSLGCVWWALWVNGSNEWMNAMQSVQIWRYVRVIFCVFGLRLVSLVSEWI